MLIIVGAAEYCLREWFPGTVLIAIALLNVLIGFLERYKAQKMLTGLSTLNVSHAHVMRNGEPMLIQARELVPGDIVVLEEGCRVPADIRLVETSNLSVMESILLGESASVEKYPDPVRGKHVGLASVTNMVFMATAVTQGRGVGVVTATGRSTEVGKISRELFASKALKTSSKKDTKEKKNKKKKKKGGSKKGNTKNGNDNSIISNNIPSSSSSSSSSNIKDNQRRKYEKSDNIYENNGYFDESNDIELDEKKSKKGRDVHLDIINNNNDDNDDANNNNDDGEDIDDDDSDTIKSFKTSGIPEGPSTTRTDFQKNVTLLGKIIILGDIFVCILIIGMMILRYRLANSVDRDELYEAVVTGISVGISGVPEGLVVVAAITMLIGLYRVQRGGGVVVKNSALVEAFGSVTTICTDKTGTLTEGKMCVNEICIGRKARFTFGGLPGAPVGPIIGPRGVPLEGPSEYPEALSRALMCGALCNNASVLYSKRKEQWVPTGTPTEVALMLAAQKAAMGKDYWLGRGWSFDREIPFSSARRCMSVIYSRRRGEGSKASRYLETFCAYTSNLQAFGVSLTSTTSSSSRSLSSSPSSPSALSSHRSSADLGRAFRSDSEVLSEIGARPEAQDSAGAAGYDADTWEKVLLMKGAPEAVIVKCTKRLNAHGHIHRLGRHQRQRLTQDAEAMGAAGTRVLALAYREMRAEEGSGSSAEDEAELYKCEAGLTFLGFVGLVDPPREGVKEAIASCKAAGISVCMITGDHPVTALAVAKQLGIVEGDGKGAVREGAELDAFSAADIDMFAGLDPFPSVFARADSMHKLRILQALQRRNEVCIMTGDGVNDAPAIGYADIGIAMGTTAVDITKQAADVVLLNNNISTIVLSIREGRAIYDNIKKFVHYLLTCNSAEVILIFLCGIIGLPVPFTPTSVLWVNVIVDVPPALSLGVDPPDKDIMERPPRDPSRTFFDMKSVLTIAYQAFVQSILTLIIYWVFVCVEEPGALNIAYGRSSNFESASSSFISDANESLSHGRCLAICTITILQLAHSFLARSLKLKPVKPCFPHNKALIFGVLFSVVLVVVSIYAPGFNIFLDRHALNWFDWLKILFAVIAYVSIITLTRYLITKHKLFSIISESHKNNDNAETGKRVYYNDY